MSGFPGSPRTLPGAIVAVDPLGPPRAIVFQYNPDEVTRILKPRTPPSGGGSAADVHRIWGAPSESISLTLELDATDGLADADPVAVAVGVAGPIAALELLLYPGTATVLSNTALLLAGTIEVLPPQGPVVVLVWGPGRVVPVKVTGVTIREQAFSPTARSDPGQRRGRPGRPVLRRYGSHRSRLPAVRRPPSRYGGTGSSSRVLLLGRRTDHSGSGNLTWDDTTAYPPPHSTWYPRTARTARWATTDVAGPPTRRR